MDIKRIAKFIIILCVLLFVGVCNESAVDADDGIEYGEGEVNDPIPIEFEAANNSEMMYKIINLERIKQSSIHHAVDYRE